MSLPGTCGDRAEDGHTDIPNEFLEKLARTVLSPNHWQVFLAIMRKTWGWHKTEDWISLSQFVEVTEIKKPHICRVLNSLEEAKMITRVGNGKGISYRIQKDFSLWKPLPKRATLPKRAKVITRPGNVSLPKRVPTKENRQKKLLPLPDSKKTNPAVAEILKYFGDAFQKRFNRPYTFNFSKEGALVKVLLHTHQAEYLRELINCFFQSADPFIRKSGYTVGVFRTQVNKLACEGRNGNGSRKPADIQEPDEADVKCQPTSRPGFLEAENAECPT